MEKKYVTSINTILSYEDEVVILIDGNDVAYLSVPLDGIVSEPVKFKIYKNSYTITIKNIEFNNEIVISILDIKNEDKYNYFISNVEFDISSEKREFNMYEYMDRDEMITAEKTRIEWSESLIKHELYDISLIINVSCLESLMKEVFELSESSTFLKHIEDTDINKNICTFINSDDLRSSYIESLLNIKDTNRFLKIYWIVRKFNKSKQLKYLLNSEKYSRENKINSLIHLLKHLYPSSISFQKLYGKKSFINVLEVLFNIDIKNFLDLNNYSKILSEMYEYRHEITHGSECSKNIKKEDAEKYLKITKELSSFIISKSVLAEY